MNRATAVSLKVDPNSKHDLTSLRRWVVAFCAIRFDLEQGQVIEECYPSGSLIPEEELEIAFNSFPDSMSQSQNRSSIHDCMFFFRFPCRRSSLSANSSSDNNKAGAANRRSINRTGSKYIYGYVFNRQRQDERLKRGGEQKSVVILSYSPYSSVFKPLLQILGPLFFDIGKRALEHVASYVSAWPVPALGKLMELPIGNATMKVYLPPFTSFLPEGSSSPDEVMPVQFPVNQSVPQGLFHDADLFGIFRGLLMQLWMLWELLLVGEPLLVIAPTPPQCCEAVASLVSLVAPLPLSVDFRPYFTIHDPDFAHLNSLKEGEPFPPMILGVTNLFFLKALRSVPHIISVGSPSSSSAKLSQGPRSSSAGRNMRSDSLNLQQLSLKKFSPSNLLTAVKLRREGPLSLMTEHKETIWSTYSSITKPDTAILNRLIDAGMIGRVEESMSVVNNEILRRHFVELTSNFLAPFGPYFRPTTPSEGVSPFLDPPPLPSFNGNEFLESLSARGPGKFLSKRMRANWLDLYRLFLRGKNFMPWFQRRRAIAEQEQQKLWRQARMRTDIQMFVSKMSELEIVDSFNAIEQHLLAEIQSQQSGRANPESVSACQKLKGDLQVVYNVLPKDMQELLLFNPQRASLLQGSLELTKLPGRASVRVEVVSERSSSI
ncbi:hypothetical protein H6P81_002744 [Aristolochia fimbriata]|uniref:UDENN domain-containing protein n=1 Tax=Aristolochia fimbriata TaxID=158543 RepID=A0AAV7FEG8_ARIFI|nr:hypothetical protein H6P81_002744 [Aristolochia fimbriata]